MSSRGAGRPPSSRPPGWTREAVLRRLEAGETIASLVRTLSAGTHLSPITLRNELANWRKRDAEYGEKVKAALEKRMGKGYSHPTKVSYVKFTPEVQDAFLKAMEENGGRVAPAADSAGVSAGLVYEKLRHNSHNFDQVFYDRFMTLESVRIAGIRESFLDAAQTNPWAAHKVLEAHPVTTELHNPKRLMEVEARHTHTHTHRLDAALMDQIVQRRSRFFGRGGEEEEGTEGGEQSRVRRLPGEVGRIEGEVEGEIEMDEDEGEEAGEVIDISSRVLPAYVVSRG